jgi:hypothetical protein
VDSVSRNESSRSRKPKFDIYPSSNINHVSFGIMNYHENEYFLLGVTSL